MATKKQASSKKGTARTKSKKREPPKAVKQTAKPKTQVALKRNDRASQTQKTRAAAQRDREEARTPLAERVESMGASHVAVSIGSGVAWSALGVVAVGQGWVGPKLTAGLMMGSGTAATAAGWYWEMDHLMAGGAGLTAAGAFSMANQLAVDAYERMEERAEKLAKEKEAKEKKKIDAKKLVEARALIAAADKQRNARRITLVSDDGATDDPPIDYVDYEYPPEHVRNESAA